MKESTWARLRESRKSRNLAHVFSCISVEVSVQLRHYQGSLCSGLTSGLGRIGEHVSKFQRNTGVRTQKPLCPSRKSGYKICIPIRLTLLASITYSDLSLLSFLKNKITIKY